MNNWIEKTKVAVIAELTAIVFGTGCYAEQMQSPNIILFLVDDMGWQDTSVPFWKEKTPINEKFHTPNMERLASEGMKFTQAYACSVCSPSRTSLMTGMNAARHGVTNWTLLKNQTVDAKDEILEFPKGNLNGLQPEGVDTINQTVEATTLPQLLKNNGYFTIHYAIQKSKDKTQDIRPEKPNLIHHTIADHWEYIGIAVEEPGYCIWGASPIFGTDGKIHLFVERWPGTRVEPGWRGESEIAHYVSNIPEGPFRFSDLALTGTGKETWDKCAVHNPAIHKVGDQYVLLYIGNNNPKIPPHASNQCIGMAVSKNLNGPWNRVGTDGKILSPPDNPKYWNYKATNGVNNPAFLQHPDGGFFLYFKSQGGKMGLAVAEKLEGPYVQMPFPVTRNNQAVEDGYAFNWQNQFCLLTTDNHGLIEKGGGILWKSADGIHFDDKEQGFYPVVKYLGEERLKKAVNHYSGKIIKFERPQVLLIDGKPAYLYVASGFHFFGGGSPVNYVMRYTNSE